MSRVGILGAGMAGLSCAWLLEKQGVETIVFEKQPYIGGLARSFKWHGFDCDFSAHRLFCHDEYVLEQLLNLVPMGRHIRRSQIYFNGQWMRDPFDVSQLFTKASPLVMVEILRTYLTRPKDLAEDSFEAYVVKNYGRKLYQFFFRPYTEKLFGIPGDQISVRWAQTKVRLANPLDRFKQSTKTKFSYFYYPLHGGYGAIPEKLYEAVQDKVLLETTVTGLERSEEAITGVIYKQNDVESVAPVDYLISTLPLTLTARMLDKKYALDYRKVDAVYLLIDRNYASDNHWIYFMDDDIAINRMVEFKNMSPLDKPDNMSVVCAEVTQEYENVAERVAADLVRTGFVKPAEILDTFVVREEFAYPVYNQRYEDTLEQAARDFGQYKNLHVVGRAAEFKHREVDDNFTAAVDKANELLSEIKAAKVDIRELPMTTPQLDRDPVVWAVILAYNNVADTHECLDSLQQTTYPLQIVLVDNGSTDDTPNLTRAKYPHVHVIENGENLWVPAGYNVGFEYALAQGADYILLLNNDTIVLPDMVDALLAEGEKDAKAGVLMPTVAYYDQPDEIWASGARYRQFPPAVIMQTQGERVQKLPELIEYAPSCGLLIRRETFEKVGLFDPNYLFINDDWDFSERVRAHGMTIKYVPAAKMLHKVSRTTQGPTSPLFWRVFGESNTIFYRRHGQPAWLSVPVHVGYIFLREFVAKRNWRFLFPFWEGVKSGLKKPLVAVPRMKQ
jgi:GT2 family glycosyltransferase/protoporphyrinogen oxidase